MCCFFLDRQKIQPIDAIDGQRDCLGPVHLVSSRTSRGPTSRPPLRLSEEGLEHIASDRCPAQRTDIHVDMRVHRHQHERVLPKKTAGVHHVHLQCRIFDKQVLEEKRVAQFQLETSDNRCTVSRAEHRRCGCRPARHASPQPPNTDRTPDPRESSLRTELLTSPNASNRFSRNSRSRSCGFIEFGRIIDADSLHDAVWCCHVP